MINTKIVTTTSTEITISSDVVAELIRKHIQATGSPTVRARALIHVSRSEMLDMTGRDEIEFVVESNTTDTTEFGGAIEGSV